MERRRGKKLTRWLRDGLSRDPEADDAEAYRRELIEAGVWDPDPDEPEKPKTPKHELKASYAWIAISFSRLSRDRTRIGGGFSVIPQNISHSAIHSEYYKRLRMHCDWKFQAFESLIVALDDVWMDDWSRREKARQDDEKRNAERGKPRGRSKGTSRAIEQEIDYGLY